MPEPAKTDAELLDRYAAGGAGSARAFELLVAEHGGMVHRVCLRILGRSDLAEDAAQAAFLVLARKARSVKGDAGAFLQGVATNVALRARESELARRAREEEAAMLKAQRSGSPHADWEHLRPHLDEAVAGLPAGERAAVTLHYLEGRSYGEVARRLAVPEGTVASRLNRAADRMREFLRKRNVELSAAALGPVILAGAGGGCPACLLAASGKIAAAGLAGLPAAVSGIALAKTEALAEAGATAVGANVMELAKGALQMMFWAKVKMAAAVAVAATVVLGTGTPLVMRALSAEGPQEKPAAQTAPDVPADPAPEVKANEPVAVDGLKVALSIDKTEAKAGEEIKLTATFENLSKEKLRVFWPVERFLADQVSLEATGDGVQHAPQMRNMMAMVPTLANFPELAPGDKKTLEIKVSGNPPCAAGLGLYFTKAGAYKLRVVYAFSDANPTLGGLEDEGKPVPGKVWTGRVQTQEVEIKLSGDFKPVPQRGLPGPGLRQPRHQALPMDPGGAAPVQPTPGGGQPPTLAPIEPL